jgi:eukaryotic-like serine/threonine-protein kinase
MKPRYTVLERLGGGGQAEVFKGISETMQGFKKSVAIKRVLPNLTTNDQFVAMFLDEARLSLFLQHANIVQVFDISKAEDGTYFLVMEYVDGCDLKALISHFGGGGKQLDIGLTLYIMIEAAKGLNYAHQLENPQTGHKLHIVHRDVSPPNIMMSKNGEVKVVDFGLAKAASQVEITDEGVVKGKFAYLSPEAALGQPVDARTDVFALGIITWEMLTGRRLFYADDPHATIKMVRQARVPSMASYNPKVDQQLEEIVRRALARDPNDRTPTAADYAEELANHLFDRELKVTSRDVSNAVKAVRASKKAPTASQSLINALIADEIAKMTSLVDKMPTADAPKAVDIVDTADWASELLTDDNK